MKVDQYLVYVVVDQDGNISHTMKGKVGYTLLRNAEKACKILNKWGSRYGQEYSIRKFKLLEVKGDS